jgi:hypothetical protein
MSGVLSISIASYYLIKQLAMIYLYCLQQEQKLNEIGMSLQ